MTARSMLACLILALAFRGSVYAQSETERGAVGGAIAGAVIGGIVGHQNDETAEGILIGGAAGGLLGGLVGRERDDQAYRQYQYQQQQMISYRQGVSLQDVVIMSQNNVGPQVMINQIQMNGVQQRPGVHEIIGLHQQGVPESVIDAMQRAPLAAGLTPVAPRQPVLIDPRCRPEPVIIYHQPAVYYGWGHYHHHR